MWGSSNGNAFWCDSGGVRFIIASAKLQEDLIERVNKALDKLRMWMTVHGLQFVLEKTEALLEIGKRKFLEAKFSVENKVQKKKMKDKNSWKTKKNCNYCSGLLLYSK